MANYREMYRRLFRQVTLAVELLQAAQQEAEALYLEQEEPLRLDVDDDA